MKTKEAYMIKPERLIMNLQVLKIVMTCFMHSGEVGVIIWTACNRYFKIYLVLGLEKNEL